MISASQTDDQQAQTDPVSIAQDLVDRLERAWNAADGAAFAEPFTDDADFVAVRGDLHTGRDAIATGHQQIFDTIYAGSTVGYEVIQARQLDDRIILAHARGSLDVPGGPLAGEHASTSSLVLVKDGDDYEIAAFHNTLVAG